MARFFHVGLIFQFCFHITSSSVLNFNQRISDPDLIYAAESRNYITDPDTLFVTCRNGGMKIFNISNGNFESIGWWNSSAPVEGQDRLGDWLVVSELGRGPSGQFPSSAGPKLHLFNLLKFDQSSISPIASVDLSGFIDAILHVKFVQKVHEVWAVCSGGFATTTIGAVVLVNLTNVMLEPSHLIGDEVNSLVNVISTVVSEPEGVMVAPKDNSYVYIGGINSQILAVVDISSFWDPFVSETRDSVGAQLVGATWSDQPYKGSEEMNLNLVYLAAWGVDGGLVLLDTANNTSANPAEIARAVSFKTSQANRVKLDPLGDFAFVPLEQELGGVAVFDISDGASVTLDSVYHVPSSEFRNGPTPLVQSTKTYCLAVSGSDKLYMFIAETGSVYVYDISRN